MGCTNALLSSLKDKKLTNETVSTINLFTGADIKLNDEGEVTDVCVAIEEMKKHAAEKAVAENRISAVENVMEGFHVSLEEACRILKHSVEDYEKAKELCSAK